MRFERLPKWVLQLIKRPPQIAYALGLSPLIGRVVLLLTTVGRKTGLPRVTPLQYEELDGVIYIGSARGTQADWYRNIVVNPHVRVQAKKRRFGAIAEVTTDCARIADFLELRLKRHPRMVGAMLRAEGLPPNPTREQIVRYSANLALVLLRPSKMER